MQYKEKGYISLVCYLRDDADVIEGFLHTLAPLIMDKFEYFQFVFVDDFSSDNTFEAVVKTLEEIKIPGSVLRLSQKHGTERGLLAGLDKAVGDFIIEFDCPVIDFPLNLINTSFEAIKSGKDIVVIHPEKALDFSTRVYYCLFNKLSYLNEPLTTERVVVMTRRALNSILSIDERVRYKKALLSLAGFPRQSIPYKPTKNNYIDKRSSPEKILSAFENFVSYTSIGSRAPIFLSALFLMISIVIGVWVTYNYFFMVDVAGVGWVSIMGFMSISFSGLFFLLGILSEYVTKILREIVNIPIYTIGQTYTSSNSNEEDDPL
jgi:polyisoprenyl-phosphate glycosyltransferase